MTLKSIFPFLGAPSPVEAAAAAPSPVAPPVTAPVAFQGNALQSADISTLIANAYTERNAAQAAQIEMQARLTVAADQITQLKAAMEAGKTALTAMTAERDDLKAKLAAAEATAGKTREEIRAEVRNQELAALAASQGAPPSAVPPAGHPPSADADDFSARVAAAKTPHERAAIRMEAFNKRSVASAA